MFNLILNIISNVILAAAAGYIVFFIIKKRFIFLIALRNVFKNTRRSVITIAAVCIGVTGIILFGGFIENSFYGLREATIRSQIGHFQIYKKGYRLYGETQSDKYKLRDFQKLTDFIYHDQELKDKIEAIAPELTFSGLISTGDNTKSFIARAVDPDADKALSSFETVKEGRKLSGGDVEKITMGSGLAKALSVDSDKSVMLLTQTSMMGLNLINVKIKGVTESFSTDYDKVYIKMPIKDSWTLLGEEYADKLIVLLYKTNDIDYAASRIKEISIANDIDIEISRWEDLAPYYKSVVSLYNGIFNFVKWVICIIIIVLIMNTLFMSVMERINEIGTLRTIGTSKMIIMQNFIIESLILGVTGGITGIVLAYILSFVINIFGIPMPPPPGSSVGYTAKIMLNANSIHFIFFSFKLAVLSAVIASLMPAKKAVDMNIADSLRYF